MSPGRKWPTVRFQGLLDIAKSPWFAWDRWTLRIRRQGGNTVLCGDSMDAKGYRVLQLYRSGKGITLLAEDYCKTSDVATTPSEDSDPKKSSIALCRIDAVWQWNFLGSGVCVVSLWLGRTAATVTRGHKLAGGRPSRRCLATFSLLSFLEKPLKIGLTFLPKRRNSPIFSASEFPGQNPSLIFELVTL